MTENQKTSFYPLLAAMNVSISTMPISWNELSLDKEIKQALQFDEELYFDYRPLLGYLIHDMRMTLEMPHYSGGEMVIETYRADPESTYVKTAKLSCDRYKDYLDNKIKLLAKPELQEGNADENVSLYYYYKDQQAICLQVKQAISPLPVDDNFFELYGKGADFDKKKRQKLLLSNNPKNETEWLPRIWKL